MRWCRARTQTCRVSADGSFAGDAFPLVGFGADVVSGSSPSTIATPVLRASGTTYKPKTSAAVGSCSSGPRLTICVPLDVTDPGAREGLRASPAAQRIDITRQGAGGPCNRHDCQVCFVCRRLPRSQGPVGIS